MSQHKNTTNNSTSIYVLKAIYLKNKTDKSLFKDWQVRNLEFENLPIGYDDYIHILENSGEKDFEIHSVDSHFFTDLDDALEYAKSMTAYINYGGAFDYLLILKINSNKYEVNINYSNPYLFKLNSNDCKYQLVENIDCKISKSIIKNFDLIDA